MRQRDTESQRLEDVICPTRAHCVACRNSAGFRQNVAAMFGVERDYPCPFGLPWGLSSNPNPAPPPMPQRPWPAWADRIGRLRRPGEAGVGDTVERLLGRAGTVTKAVLARFGIPCGCGDRKRTWNALYPYE